MIYRIRAYIARRMACEERSPDASDQDRRREPRSARDPTRIINGSFVRWTRARFMCSAATTIVRQVAIKLDLGTLVLHHGDINCLSQQLPVVHVHYSMFSIEEMF